MKKLFVLLFLITLKMVVFPQSNLQKEHDLLVMPTAFTLEKGEGYFTDYELFVLNLGWAPTSSTHISALSLFPITADALETFSVGVKQNLKNADHWGMAMFGSFTPKYKGYTIGGVGSYLVDHKLSIHLGFGLMGDTDSEGSEGLYLAGLKIDASQKFAFIVEYTNFETAAENDFKGLINLGCRFRSKSLLIDFGGFRPLESTDDIILLPFLKGTVFFGKK